MFSSGEKNGTKFIWKIENFSCIKETMLPSPTFSSHSAMWELRICPTLLENVKYIDVELHHFKKLNETLNCSLAILSSGGSPLIWKEKQNDRTSLENQVVYTTCIGGFSKPAGAFGFGTATTAASQFGTPCIEQQESFSNSRATSLLKPYAICFSRFIEWDEMFGSRRSTFLPDNTLTVQCLIWRNSNELLRPLKCFARTRFEPEAETTEKSFIWNIDNLGSFTNYRAREELMGINGDSVTIQLFLDSAGEFTVSFKTSLLKTHLKVQISVISFTGENIPFVKSECQFEKMGQNWNLSTKIWKTMLTFHKNLLLPNDTLSLQFVYTQTGNISFHRMVDEYETFVNNPSLIVASNKLGNYHPIGIALSGISKPEDNTDKPDSKQSHKAIPSDSISQALKDMYEEGFLSDCFLKTGNREFPVHKAFLGVRSQVFKAMFTTEMKEKEGNCVVIPDVDEDTLHKLLLFVYSDSVEENMGCEDASRLYTAADKYALESLKQKCSSIIKSGFNISSVLEVLKLSDMHHDQDLKSAVLDYISCNNNEIIGTESWLIFEEENAKLAFETFRKLHSKKMDD